MRDVFNAPVSEYAEWVDHYSRHPPGDWRTHQLLAILCSIVFNANRDPKRTPPVQPWDFAPELMPEDEKEARIERQQEMNEMLVDAEVNRILMAMGNG